MKEEQIREGENGTIIYYEEMYWIENNGRIARLNNYNKKGIKRLGSMLDIGEKKAEKHFNVVSCFQNGNS